MKKIIILLSILCFVANSKAQDDGFNTESAKKFREFYLRFIPYADSITGFMGLKTSNGSVVLEPIFQIVNHVSPEGYIDVRIHNKWGVVDTTGKTIIPCIWDEINRVDTPEPMFRVTTDAIYDGHIHGFFYSQGRSGYLNEKNEVVIPVEYSHIGRFFNDEGITSFTKSKFVYRAWNWTISENPYKKSRWGLISKRGEIVLPDHYYTYIGFGHGPYFVAFKGKRTTVIDKTGKRYTKLKYTKRTEYEKEIRKLYDEWAKGQQKHDNAD